MICIPLWILTGAYVCYIIEEYRFNWREWAMQLSKLDLKWSEFYIVNAVVLVFGIASAIVGFFMMLIPIGLQLLKNEYLKRKRNA